MVLSQHHHIYKYRGTNRINTMNYRDFFHANRKTKREHGTLITIIISTALKSEQNPITTLLVDKLTLVNSFCFFNVFFFFLNLGYGLS